MSAVNFNPSPRELRQFGCFAALFLPGFGFLLAQGGTDVGVAVVVGAIGAVLFMIGLIRPRSLRAVYVGLRVATAPIGWLLSHFVLVFLFYVVLTPIALVWRLCGRDALAVRRSRSTESYWHVRGDETRMESYFCQS